MKRHIKTILFILFSQFFVSGCKKYLDIKPRGVDIATTIDQYSGMFNNTLLTSFDTYQIGSGSIAPGSSANLSCFLAPESYTTAPYYANEASSYINGYRWDPTVYLSDQNAAEWYAFYELNYTYNVIAAGVMGATDGTDDEKKALLAEARANRAFLHLMLVNYFGKPYNPATASTDPGVPIITVPAASAPSGPRATVQQVYDFVIGELEASIPDLPVNTVNRLRLYKPAALYMLGQTYFLMGNYDSALTQLEAANALLPGSTAAMALYDYNTTISQWTPPIPNFPPSVPIGPNNTEEICQRRMTVGTFTGVLFIDSTYAGLYTSSDLRLKLFMTTDYSGSAHYPGYSRAAPYQVNYGPSIPNLYLMMAECKARTGDISGANADLVTLRQHRMPAAEAGVSISDADSLIRFIVNERFREYALTGLTWFDIRRLWNDPLFKGRTYQHTDDAGTYALTEDRLTLKIPPYILSLDPSMQDNP